MNPDNGKITIDADGCKGCGLCVEACKPGLLSLSGRLNHNGYRVAEYAGQGCNGCGLCFYVCPEPGVLTVYKLVAEGAFA